MPRIAVSVCCALLLSAPLLAERPIDLSAKGARTHRQNNLSPLTSPSNASRADVVRGFLAQRGRGPAAQALQVVSENAVHSSGITHTRMEQDVAGLKVYGVYAKAAIDGQGRLLSLVENTVDPAPVRPSRINAADAINAAVALHYRGAAPAWFRQPSATRVAIPVPGGLEEGYLVETWEDANNVLWHSLVDATGEVVHTELRTNTDTYKIFADHPGNSTQTVVTGPGLGNSESPSGWVANNTTIGNNVDAYLDRDNNNAADAGGRPVSATQNFEYTVDLTQAPTVSINQQGAVANLFYLNNVIHDRLYRHGFTEAAGNFQTNNFGKGGSGNDPVNAEAQDGGGTNNANFSTPADGSRPRMQMYIWTKSTPNRDGDLDSDIVWHEYGHGLTWRMIGGMSGGLAGAIGEGMSDTLSIYINRNDVVGEYSNNNTLGIRRFPYTNYPNTYSDVTGSSVHADGEIYAATMWKLLSLWEAAGYTQDELFNNVVDGMNYTPSTPAYEDMRDGILASSPTQEKDCVVWKAFAQFGIGEGANGTQSCNILRCTVSVTESFVVPSVCGGAPPPPPPPAGISLTVTGRKVKSTPNADLVWSGATGTTIDVYRNNVKVVNTANDGAHTDTLPKGPGTYTYRVCEAGTQTCSNNATVSF